MSKTAESKPAPKTSVRSPARGNGGERDIAARLFALETEMKHVATKEDVAKLRTEMKTDMAEFRAEIKSDMAKLDARLARMEGGLTTLRWMMGVSIAFISVAIALSSVLIALVEIL